MIFSGFKNEQLQQMIQDLGDRNSSYGYQRINRIKAR